jgi:MFS family permease
MAWMQIASSFLIFFNVLGLINTCGQFQTIYETDILKNEKSSTIAWIGSVQFLICYVVCNFTGPLWDAGRLYLLLGSGTVIMVFGLIMLGLCHEYYQFFLAQAVVTGVGFGFVFMSASGIVPQWFSTRAPFAVGIATTSSSIGKLSGV